MVVDSRRSRILEPPAASFFLFGIRGVGKSTWARQTFPTAPRFDLLDEGLFHQLLADPALFGAQLRALEPDSWVVVDEVQRLPSLLNEVHRAIEERGQRFVLLGSSARKLKAAGTNLLAGRARWKRLYPFVPEELGAAFDLESALAHGSIPLILAAEDRAEALPAYVQLYLREEIRAEALVRNLPGFVRFLPIAALCHGQMINVASIARDAGVARTTVQGYLEILEDSLLTWRLSAHEARLRVRERAHPKLYWVDPGVVRAVKRQLGPLATEERGPLFEGWVHTLLRAYHEKSPLFDELSYWSPAESRTTEVDFLLQRGGDHLALEVKASQRFTPGLTAGLRAIGDLPRLARRVLVYLGERELRTEEGIEVWPLPKLLAALAEGRLWP
ncbi:MAG TPA: AAA family ATPase [Thermoanaerobaculia bacterium]|nr:AAA family ATPase [Thermoanaerobaculia bacterium]